MIITLIILSIGFLCGFVLRKKSIRVDNITRYLSFVVTLLVFVMGVSLGSDENLLENIMEIGWTAFAFGIVSVAGSILLVEIVNLFVNFNR